VRLLLLGATTQELSIKTPSQPVLQVNGIDLNFGGIQALSDIALEAKEGEILAVIGPNGAGKTCLLNSICGFYHPQRGDIVFNGKRINHLPTYKRAEMGIARVFQNVELFTGLTSLQNIMAGRHPFIRPRIFSSLIYFGWEHKKDLSHRKRCEDIIDLLEMEAIRDKVVGSLPYGLRKRVELARALALEPKLLLLDEPMAGMNMEEKEDMARYILDINEEWNEAISIILIEHQMDVVMDISDRVVALDFGRVIAQGTPDDIKKDPAVIKAYLGET
jgi:branched-chain amino acid transport system ATP-binding protein